MSSEKPSVKVSSFSDWSSLSNARPDLKKAFEGVLNNPGEVAAVNANPVAPAPQAAPEPAPPSASSIRAKKSSP